MAKRRVRAEHSHGSVTVSVGSGPGGPEASFALDAANAALLASLLQAAVTDLMRGDMRTRPARDLSVWLVPFEGKLGVFVE